MYWHSSLFRHVSGAHYPALLSLTAHQLTSHCRLLGHFSAFFQDFVQTLMHLAEHSVPGEYYRVSHKPHHRWLNPRLFDAFNGSTADTVFMILIPLFITANLVHCNVWSYMAFGTIYANYLTLIHSEFAYPWDLCVFSSRVSICSSERPNDLFVAGENVLSPVLFIFLFLPHADTCDDLVLGHQRTIMCITSSSSTIMATFSCGGIGYLAPIAAPTAWLSLTRAYEAGCIHLGCSLFTITL